MPKMKRDTTRYTAFGRLLDELCVERKISFRRLAEESGMSVNSQMSIVRACRGESVPLRASILAWCRVLDVTTEQRARLLHSFHYATPEEEQRSELENASQGGSS